MWIKICGNTNLEDVRMAADAGADAVGFVFASSPRRVTAGHIAAMMPDLPADLTKIGVFDTQNFDEIALALQSAGVHGVQLHGELDFSLAEKLRNQFDPGFFLIQTLHWDLNSDPARAEERLRNELRAIARHRRHRCSPARCEDRNSIRRDGQNPRLAARQRSSLRRSRKTAHHSRRRSLSGQYPRGHPHPPPLGRRRFQRRRIRSWQKTSRNPGGLHSRGPPRLPRNRAAAHAPHPAGSGVGWNHGGEEMPLKISIR